MKRKIAVTAILLLILTFMLTLTACNANTDTNAPGVTIIGGSNNSIESDNSGGSSSSDIPELSWSSYSSSEVRIIDGGLHPKEKTIAFDFGYNTIEMQKKGYSTLTFTLKFNAFIDDAILGISSLVSTNVNSYFLNENSQFTPKS